MIVAGFGFRGAATEASLLAALGEARPQALAAPEDKAAAPCLAALSRRLRLPVIPVPPGALLAVTTLTHSPRVQEKRGTGSVAEAAALAAAGPKARLLGPRTVSPDRMATCALAERKDP